MRRIVTAGLLLSLALRARCAVHLPSVFADHAVLQTNSEYGQRSFVYGSASVGETVVINVTIAEKVTTYTTVADFTGSWDVQLNPAQASSGETSAEIDVAGSSDGFKVTRHIRDVRFGDVFLCSGQSNMDFSVMATFGGAEIAANPYPNIRLFPVAEGGALSPQADVPAFINASVTPCWWWQTQAPNASASYACNTWQAAAPGATEYFSAVCLLTALDISRAYTANRTIGLIFAAVGGTAISNWMPPEALAACNVTTSPPPAPPAAVTGVRGRSPPVLECPGCLFNAMIFPFQRFALRSFLWYQGEADSGLPPGEYSCRFGALIASWRNRWRIGAVGFSFVQLAPQFTAAQPDYGWFQVRLEQATVLPGGRLGIDATGMAVALDLGDMGSPYPPDHVHIRNKTEVARRLAAAVLHDQYALQWPAGGFNASGSTNWRGPLAVSALQEAGGAVRVTFDTLDGSPLTLHDTAGCWECCAQGRDTVQVAATAAGPWVNSTVALAAPAFLLATPVSAGSWAFVRYAAHTWPQCAVYAAGNAMPAPPSLLSVTAAAHTGAAAVALTHPFRTGTGIRGRPQHRAAAASAADVLPVPPMGFNSWNTAHTNIDEDLIRRTADALVSTGLAALGYVYVNIDDGWQVDRLPNGTILADPARFPSGMPALAAYVHSRGLKFGLYTSSTATTCQGRPGAYGYEAVDAATYCSWGIDYLKIDNCGGTRYANLSVSWGRFRDAFNACASGGGRSVVESVEYCSSVSGCGAWVANFANLWRTTGDIQATWASVMANLDANNAMAPLAGPGHFNDPDLLQVGNTGLSLAEQRSQMSAWALVAAPLLISTDLASGVDNATLAVLGAPEVIAVSQDPLGVQGVRVSPPAPAGPECWAKPVVGDGAIAAVLLNRGPAPADVSCSWAELGFAAGVQADVRDLWARADLGTFTGSFTAQAVEPHGAVMVRVTPQVAL